MANMTPWKDRIDPVFFPWRTESRIKVQIAQWGISVIRLNFLNEEFTTLELPVGGERENAFPEVCKEMKSWVTVVPKGPFRWSSFLQNEKGFFVLS